jgi:hypothetical protein
MSLSIDLHRNRGTAAASVGRWLELRGWLRVVLTARPPLWKHEQFGHALFDTTEALIRSACHEAEWGSMETGEQPPGGDVDLTE